MPILTATEVTQYSNISASAATIAASGLIAQVQERFTQITNNYFTTDLYVRGSVTFNATDGTITLEGGNWATYGFADGDEVYVYRSYRNDGYIEVDSVSGSVLTITSAYSVVDELSGRSILFSVVRWPESVKQPAALMVAYDYDSRGSKTPGVTSHSLGPFSESFGGSVAGTPYGYPAELVDMLRGYTIVRLM